MLWLCAQFIIVFAETFAAKLTLQQLFYLWFSFIKLCLYLIFKLLKRAHI